MATVDRFKNVLKKGALPDELGGAELTAQAKYDFLAAVHTMEQIQNVAHTLEKRAVKRNSFREKVCKSSRNALEKILPQRDEAYSVAEIDHAIKILTECRAELLAMDGEEKADHTIQKLIADGITAK